MDLLNRLVRALVAVLLLSGCGAVTNLPTVLHQTDTVYISKTETEVVRDSIYITDREVVREKGDTVFVERWNTQYRDRWHDREIHDTTYVDKIIEKEVIKEVERDLTWVQTTLLGLGKAFLVLLGVLVLYVAFRLLSSKISLK